MENRLLLPWDYRRQDRVFIHSLICQDVTGSYRSDQGDWALYIYVVFYFLQGKNPSGVMTNLMDCHVSNFEL